MQTRQIKDSGPQDCFPLQMPISRPRWWPVLLNDQLSVGVPKNPSSCSINVLDVYFLIAVLQGVLHFVCWDDMGDVLLCDNLREGKPVQEVPSSEWFRRLEFWLRASTAWENHPQSLLWMFFPVVLGRRVLISVCLVYSFFNFFKWQIIVHIHGVHSDVLVPICIVIRSE